MLHYNMNVTFKKECCIYAYKGRNARLPGGDHRGSDRQQVEAAHHAQPALAPVALQRAEKGSGGHQPESADR